VSQRRSVRVNVTARAWRHWSRRFAAAFCAVATTQLWLAPPAGADERETATPIKHLVVIIGENQGFDHLFGTYVSRSGARVGNMLSKGIVNIDGTPGPNFRLGGQYSAKDTDYFRLSPGTKQAYAFLPAETTGTVPASANDGNVAPPFATVARAQAYMAQYYPKYYTLMNSTELLSGASGLPANSPDARIASVNQLSNGPFPLTGLTPYDFILADPIHSFFAEWQQADCSVEHATQDNPSGCLNDLFPWVEGTRRSPSNGSVALGFYNVAHGDVPYLTGLAQTYTMSDNYHQAMRGPSSPNWIYFGAADEYYYSDGNGNPAIPPASLISNPDPQPGTNNVPVNDSNFIACADPSAPGVASVQAYLASLPYRPNPHCAAGAYYHVASRHPGYFGDGTPDTNSDALPPSTVRTIGDELSARDIPWAWYGAGWNSYLADPKHVASPGYCDNCNPFQFSKSIMSTAASRTAHLKDAEDLLTEIKAGTLPAVAYLRTVDFDSGHPAVSKMENFEAFVKLYVDAIQAQPQLWRDTAILITFDEGGGYWDSGYVQPVDFFGDGVRVPMIVVSPYSLGGHVGHSYSDHASVVKFIERNWRLGRLSAHSRDNLPNPIQRRGSPYVPVNSPAIGDLTDLFCFGYDGHCFGDEDGEEHVRH
jgi:phospholipase C